MFKYYDNGEISYNPLEKKGYTTISKQQMTNIENVSGKYVSGKYVCEVSEFENPYREPDKILN